MAQKYQWGFEVLKIRNQTTGYKHIRDTHVYVVIPTYYARHTHIYIYADIRLYLPAQPISIGACIIT